MFTSVLGKDRPGPLRRLIVKAPVVVYGSMIFELGSHHIPVLASNSNGPSEIPHAGEWVKSPGMNLAGIPVQLLVPLCTVILVAHHDVVDEADKAKGCALKLSKIACFVSKFDQTLSWFTDKI